MKKRKYLFLPLVLSFLVLLLALCIFGIVRYFALAEGEGFQSEAFFRVLWETLPALGVLAVLGLFALVYLALSVAKPMKKMRMSVEKTAQRVTNGAERPVPVGAGCVGKLSDALVAEEGEIAALLAAVAKESDAQAAEREKLSAARAVCAVVAPDTIGLETLTYGVRASILRVPSVGADFCDAFALDGRRVFIAVGDVWEQGLSAALLSARSVRTLRENIAAGHTPAQALSALNRALIADGSGGAATVFCAIFDSVSGELHYANAGHLPPVIAGEACSFLRMRAGAPLGFYADAEFSDETFGLHAGQGLVVYTDGVVNSSDGKELFGYGRLLSTVQKYYANALETENVAQGVLAAAEDFAKAEDDRAVLALFFPAGVRRLLSAERSEAEKMRELLENWLHEDPRKKNIQIACEEIFANIVEHAGAKAIQINCEREENSFIIRFTDDGEPFNPLQTDPGDPYAEENKGLTIIRRIAGEIFYRTKQNLNVLTVRFPIIKGL